MTPSCLIADYDVTGLSAFHTEAKVDYFYEIHAPSDVRALHEIYEFSIHKHLPIILIGRGTNFLFAFKHFHGILIKMNLRGFTFDGDVLTVSAGELVSLVSQKVYTEYNNSGLMSWVGLPGTWGGAIAGNAGCFGLETKDFLIDVEVYDMVKGVHETLTNAQCGFLYRGSKLKAQSQRIILSARFNLSVIPQNTYNTMSLPEFMSIRREKQPTGYTCGSFFKNPPGESAGRLIDAAGLKGTRMGGVKISEQHANFFINDEKGGYDDILALRDLARKCVREKFGIELEEEVRIIQAK